MAGAQHQIIGRYAIYDEIASGGMATVHIGRLVGPIGFSRTVAIKRLHPHFAKDQDFVDMFVDEARLAARIRHPNVVPTLDVVKTDNELFLVMEYVQGEALSRIMRRARRVGTPIPPRLAVATMIGVLHGLHAAHNAKGERGEPLLIVHRDVSPQNILVGTDGVARVFDFGIAKARGRIQTTREGQIKGKLAYMAPEQLSGAEVERATDVYAAAVVLWELLAGQRLFEGDNEAVMLAQVLNGARQSPGAFNPQVSEKLDAIVMQALSRRPEDRFPSARAMAVELERNQECATATEIGEWVEEIATITLTKRAERIAEIESHSEIKLLGDDMVVPSAPQSWPTMPPEGHSHSQLSSISVARSHTRERGGNRRLVAALVAALVVAVGALVVSRFGAADDPAVAPRDGTPLAAPVAPPVAPDTPESTSSQVASAAPSSESRSAASSEVEAPAAVSAPPRPRWSGKTPPRSVPPSAPAQSSAPAPKPDNCSPPFTVDAEGIRHPKPECL
jgi:serine/threonine-protein kinase